MSSRAAYQREWKLKNPDKVKASRERQREKTPEHTRLSAKKWAKENYKRRKGYNLKRMYGIDRQAYDAMLKAQNGLCAICHKAETTTRNGTLCELVVDHDHITGKVRKLLCNKCNVGLGMLEENSDRMRQMAEYIDSFAEKSGGVGC